MANSSSAFLFHPSSSWPYPTTRFVYIREKLRWADGTHTHSLICISVCYCFSCVVLSGINSNKKESRDVAIKSWFDELPSFFSKVVALPQDWRKLQMCLNNLNFKSLKTPPSKNGMKVLFLQHDYFYKEHWQLWRYIRRRIVARKRDGQGISKSFGKLAWYTNFETVSISRNFYKCDAT